MPPARFEPAIPASERSQTRASDRAATGIGNNIHSIKCDGTTKYVSNSHISNKSALLPTSSFLCIYIDDHCCNYGDDRNAQWHVTVPAHGAECRVTQTASVSARFCSLFTPQIRHSLTARHANIQVLMFSDTAFITQNTSLQLSCP
jgi:hypothetical protein